MKAATIAASLVVCLAASGASHSAAAQGPPDLAGGWIVTSWTSADGAVDSSPQRGLFLFTASGNYSIMHVNSDEPRSMPEGDDATAEERLAVLDAFTANSGRYRVDGHQITYEAYVAKNPGYMAGFMTDEGNAETMEYSIDGGILTLRWTSGRGAGRSATLRRPGQG